MHFETQEQIINSPVEKVYAKLADMKNLEGLADKLPQGVPTISVIDSDKCEILTPVGVPLVVYYKEKQPTERLVLSSATSSLPVSFELTLLLRSEEPEVTHLRVALQADIPLFAQAFLGKDKIEAGVNKIAQALAMVNYEA